MNIVIFGGATEGRILSWYLAERGAAVTVCVATEYGREIQGERAGIRVLAGRKDRREMEAVLRNAALCVDATHPYAAEASATIQAACLGVGVPYRRLLREASETGDALELAGAAEAAAYLKTRDGKILLATGVKELECFSGLDPSRLFPRILPTHEGLHTCEALGIPRRNVIAMQGPFSRELNEALLRQFHIRYLVTKDGGKEGGFPEKAQAAANTGAVLVVLRRPVETGESFAEIVKLCGEMMGWK